MNSLARILVIHWIYFVHRKKCDMCIRPMIKRKYYFFLFCRRNAHFMKNVCFDTRSVWINHKSTSSANTHNTWIHNCPKINVCLLILGEIIIDPRTHHTSHIPPIDQTIRPQSSSAAQVSRKIRRRDFTVFVFGLHWLFRHKTVFRSTREPRKEI